MPGKKAPLLISRFSSSYQDRLSLANTLKSISPNPASGVVLNFGEGGSMALGVLVPALSDTVEVVAMDLMVVLVEVFFLCFGLGRVRAGVMRQRISRMERMFSLVVGWCGAMIGVDEKSLLLSYLNLEFLEGREAF
jgi:hypothetical protein